MPRETFLVARRRIFYHLVLAGWAIKRDLKVPQAVRPGYPTLYFRTQSVYLGKHSLWCDIRAVTGEQFVAEVEFAIKARGLS
jgi:hypothetical protein